VRYPREACHDHAKGHPAGPSYPWRAGLELDTASLNDACQQQAALTDSRIDRHSVQERISFLYVKLFIFISFCS